MKCSACGAGPFLTLLGFQDHECPRTALRDSEFTESESIYSASEVAAAIKGHYLTGIECNHADRTDVATCWCGRWRSEPQPSVGAAVDRWIEHVMAALETECHSQITEEKS